MSACPLCLGGPARFACKVLLYADCELEIHDCPDCGAAFYSPAPSPEQIGLCYPAQYFEGFFKQYWQDYYKGRSLALSLARLRPSGALLDVGCALGTLLAGARDHSAWKVSGLELSREAADMGRELNNVEIVSAPVALAPWPDASFDCVHMNNVLEHESDPQAALRAAVRLLKDGGRLVMSVPNGPVDLLPNRILYRREGRAALSRHGGHLFFFSRRSLTLILEEAGFKDISILCFHFKMGMKARGWLPGAWRRLQPSPMKRDALPLEEYRRLIPPKPGWALYRLRQLWRRLWRASWSDFGCDFAVTAEK
ncbi:MAG: class I SAM-dependent methyltransferase [Elusimicrobia bacterium]|nr:class I SAM-dependent methyltransferase [Elusimicrobiota bacterium]